MRKRQYLWEIRRFGGSFAKLLGTVYAADEDSARRAALKELNIRPEDQKRLLIRRSS